MPRRRKPKPAPPPQTPEDVALAAALGFDPQAAERLLRPRPVVVWHLPRGGRAWRKVGEYTDRLTAIDALDRVYRQGGGWAMLPPGERPGAKDKDDEGDGSEYPAGRTVTARRRRR
jgi:hypothetical protein